MILVPKFNHLYIVQNDSVPINQITFELIDTFLEEYRDIEISFDGKKFVDYEDGMEIPAKYHNTKSINLKLRVKVKGKWKTFVADEMVTTSVILLGLTTDQIYPESINQLFTIIKEQGLRINRLEESTKKLRDIVLEIHESGDIGGIL